MMVIQKVATNHRNKSFDYHTPEDIEQEVWIICLDKISEFSTEKAAESNNMEKSLERFLNRVVARRLANFYRDNYVVKQRPRKSDKSEFHHQQRINLMHPIGIDDIPIPVPDDTFEENEQWGKLIKDLDLEHLDILDAILSGEIVNCYYRNKLNRKIEEIFGDGQENDDC